MEKGRYILNGVDLADLGIFIAKGGSNDLLCFPERRQPTLTDWAEHDGLEVDYADIYFKEKKITIAWIMTAVNSEVFKENLNTFQTLHEETGYRQLTIAEFNSSYTLRYLGFSNFQPPKRGLLVPGKHIAHFAVDYVMDNPLQGLDTGALTPISCLDTLSYVSINGVDLSYYNIVVTDMYASAMRPPMVKDRLVIENPTGGVLADTSWVKKQAKEVVVNCTMFGETVEELKHNLSALFAQCNTSNPILVTSLAGNFKCIYKQMTGFVKHTPFRRKIKVSYSLILLSVEEF